MAIAEPVPLISVDLTTLSGWANVTSGSHTLTIKAKADGYPDSPASAGVTFEKAAEVTQQGTVLTITNANATQSGTEVTIT